MPPTKLAPMSSSRTFAPSCFMSASPQPGSRMPRTVSRERLSVRVPSVTLLVAVAASRWRSVGEERGEQLDVLGQVAVPDEALGHPPATGLAHARGPIEIRKHTYDRGGELRTVSRIAHEHTGLAVDDLVEDPAHGRGDDRT